MGSAADDPDRQIGEPLLHDKEVRSFFMSKYETTQAQWARVMGDNPSGIIAGLEAAAKVGVLHRDIKPSNCFVDTYGTVKIGDFGLSISTEVRGDSHLTEPGSFLGTPAFSSPEQLRGDELDIRSDIYAVGVTLYYLITGKTPFESDNLV